MHTEGLALAMRLVRGGLPNHFTSEERLAFINWCSATPEDFSTFLSFRYSGLRVETKGQMSLWNQENELMPKPPLRVVGLEPGGTPDVLYRFFDTSLGRMLCASTELGLCFLSFVDADKDALDQLRSSFPGSNIRAGSSSWQAMAFGTMHSGEQNQDLVLNLRGTTFQLSVWRYLLRLPPGTLTTYGDIAEHLGSLTYSRAVGSAVGANAVAILVPCHRVVNKDGSYGQFRWGSERKRLLIALEACKTRIAAF